MTLFVSNLIELAQTSADQNESMEEFQASLNAMMDRHTDVDPDTLVQTLIDNGAPAFEKETAESEAARQVIQNTAKEQIRKAILDFRDVKDYVFPAGYSRCFRSAIFTGGSNPAKNEEDTRTFLGKVNHPDLAVKHEAFLDLMDRFRLAEPEKWMNLSDEQMAGMADQIMPLLNMAFEAQNMYNYFKSAGVPITPEEEKRWDALTGKIGEVTPFVYSRLNMLCSPYYPKIDYKKLPLDDPEFWENAENLVDGEASSFLNDVTQYYNSTHSLSIQNAIINVLGRENLQNNLNGFSINSAPTFDLAGPDGRKYSTLDYDKDGPAGKPLFVFIGKVKNQLVEAEKERLRSVAEQEHWSAEKLQKELNNEKGILKRVSEANPDKFFCVQDLAGNGVYTVVPPPVKKPGGFFRFLHNVSKFFGGKGRDDCNNYDRYTDEIDRLREAAEEKSPFDDFNKASKEQSEAHGQVLQSRDAIVSARIQIRESDMRIANFLGTQPKDHERCIQRNCYQRGDLDLTAYELPEGITEEQFVTVSFAKLADINLSRGVRDDLPGLSEDASAKQCYTHLTEDLLYKSDASTREKSGAFLRVYGPARKAAKDALDAYAAGNKEPLARILGESIPRQIKGATPDTTFTNVFYQASKCLDRELAFLRNDPELMQLSGVTQEQLQNANAIVKMGEIYDARLKASETLVDAANGKTELSPGDRQKCIEDILLYQAVEQRERLNRLDFETNDPEMIRNREESIEQGNKMSRLREDPQLMLEANQRILVLQQEQFAIQSGRPQSQLLRSLSDPENGQAAMEQLRQKVRSSAMMRKVCAKSLPEQVAYAGTYDDTDAKALYQEVFVKPPVPKLETVGVRQRSKSVSQPKIDGVKLG